MSEPKKFNQISEGKKQGIILVSTSHKIEIQPKQRLY